MKQTLDVADGLPKLGARTEALVRTSTVEGEDTGTDLHHPDPQVDTDQTIQPLPDAGRGAAERAAADHQPPRPCGCAETDLCLHGLHATVGVEFPLTHRVGDYLGQPRAPQQVIAAMIDELDAKERAEDQAAADSLIVEEPLWGDPAPPFCYLAGPAGCGKTFAVKAWQERSRGLMLLATTGIAAINLGGTTINAALGYFDTASMQESYTNGFLTARLGRLWRAGVRRLVVDEVSMLDGDQLTYLVKAIEEVNGRGYVLGKWADPEEEGEPPAMGLTLVGDFAQLPPVKASFAWESPEWPRFAEPGHTITLTEIRRQSDPAFVAMLRQARVGNGRAVLDYLRGRIHQDTDDTFEGPTLFAKNEAVDRYNWIRLSRVEGPDCYFESRREGDQRAEWGSPKKPPHTWGIPLRLHVKVGALVMVLANEREDGPPPQPFIYVNGDLGTVVGAEGTHTCLVELQRTGEVVKVRYVRREVLMPCDSARRKELRELKQEHKISENGKFEVTGWVEYLPLRVAYGSTVHKSQGLSLDRVQVNIRDAFFKQSGMLYVALSRCRSAAGLRVVGSEAALVERCAADPRLKAWL